jgi:hypothetical protein
VFGDELDQVGILVDGEWLEDQPTKEVPMDSNRRIALVAGVLFVITFVAGIAGALIYGPVLSDPRYIVGAGADTQVFVGAFLELNLIVANIGTAVVLFPILKRQNEGAALGYVTARVVECTFILIGILSLLTIVTLRQAGAGAAGADAGSLVTVGKSLVAIHNWTFLLGPGFVVGIGNGMLLGYLMYRSGLVPRWMAMVGLVGGPLLTVSGLAVLLGVIPQFSVPQGIATIPEIVWEGTLALYLTFRGFRPSPILSSSPAS